MGDEENMEEGVEAALSPTPPVTAALDWLEPIYREHSTTVLHAAFRITGNADDAEDVLHTVFLRLANRSHPPDLSGGAGPYLRRAATNAALDLVTSMRVRTSTALDDDRDHLATDPSPRPDHARFAADIRQRLLKALTGLNRRNAEMFVLRYLEDLDNHAIAEQMETSAGTVAVTLHRIRDPPQGRPRRPARRNAMTDRDHDLDTTLDRALDTVRRDVPDELVTARAVDRVWQRLMAETPLTGCADFRALLPDLIAGRLAPARALLVEDHTRECLACRRELIALRTGRVATSPPRPQVLRVPPGCSAPPLRWPRSASAGVPSTSPRTVWRRAA